MITRDDIPYLIHGLLWIAIIVMVCVLPRWIKKRKYEKTTYYRITHNPYSAVKRDLGKWGEYLTFLQLKEYESVGGKFLFNLYLPKNETETSELDVVLITTDGIFVFESKNYSGWIFGNERQRTWTQTLPAGRGGSAHKEHFYNPVWQNHQHIKVLKAVLSREVPVYSVIVFSDRCTFKDITVTDPEISVIHRADVVETVKSRAQNTGNALTPEDIDSICNRLYPLTQITEAEKLMHIQKIREMLKTETALQQDSPETDIADPAPEIEPKQEPEPSISDPVPVQLPDADGNGTADGPAQLSDCPFCGGKLVLRTATKGARAGKQFYGCSNYPKCRYVKNL